MKFYHVQILLKLELLPEARKLMLAISAILKLFHITDDTARQNANWAKCIGHFMDAYH